LKGLPLMDPYAKMLVNDVRIHWPAIPTALVDAAQKGDFAGLQVADCVASGMRAALEYEPYGNTEHRYAKIMKPTVYRSRGRHMSYGLKFFPSGLEDSDPRSHWLRKYYI